ncbi:MAG: hypothetical protein ACM3X4_01575 [Ignavibacteriales bacterium]
MESRTERSPSVTLAVQKAIESLKPQTQVPPVYSGQYTEGPTPPVPQVGEGAGGAAGGAALSQAAQRAVASLTPQGGSPVGGLPPTIAPATAPGQSAGLGGIAGIGGQAVGGTPGVTAEPGVGIGLGVYGGTGGSTRRASQGLGSDIGYQPGDQGWKGKNITYPEGVGPNIGYQPGEEGWQGGRGQTEANTAPNFKQIQAEMNAAIGEALNANLALAQSWLSNMTATLDQLQTQIMDMYKQQGTDVDPATQAAIAQLKADMEQQLRAIDEQMNARGLAQSGYLLQEQAKILSGGWTQEERLLAARLSDIQNRMTDALMSFAQQRMNMMGNAMQNVMSAQQWAGQQMAQVPLTMANMQNQWNQWWNEMAAQQRREAQQQYQWAQEQATGQRRWAAEQQWARERFGTEAGLRQQEIDIQRQRASQPSQPSASQQLRDARSQALYDVRAELEEGKDPNDIRRGIVNNWDSLIQEGVNPQDLLTYLEEWQTQYGRR